MDETLDQSGQRPFGAFGDQLCVFAAATRIGHSYSGRHYRAGVALAPLLARSLLPDIQPVHGARPAIGPAVSHKARSIDAPSLQGILPRRQRMTLR